MSIGYNPKTIPETKRKIHLVGDCHEVETLEQLPGEHGCWNENLTQG